jgi:RNA polymerase sigma-70 factor (ECF subfamily)
MGAAIRHLVGESARNHPLSDEAIVERVLGGDTALFEVVMRRNNRRIYRAVRAIVRDEAEVEDVMQQAYVSAYAHLRQFSGAASLGTWLTKIAVHEALARVRKRARFVATDPSEQDERAMKEPSSEASNPERQAARRELGGLLEAAIDRLPEHYRTVFVLREVEDLSTAETADCLGLTAELVKVRLHRAKAKLRDDVFARVGRTAGELFQFHAPRCDRVVAAVFARIEA